MHALWIVVKAYFALDLACLVGMMLYGAWWIPRNVGSK